MHVTIRSEQGFAARLVKPRNLAWLCALWRR